MTTVTAPITITARPPPPQLRVLFFDVFGTCVAQRPPVAEELWRAAQAALDSDESSSTMSGDVRKKAMGMSLEDWDKFGQEWNKEGEKFVRESIAKHGSVDWRAVDQHRIELLPILLARRGLIIPPQHGDEGESATDVSASSSVPKIGKGSLWSDPSQLQHLGRIWHRLPPWRDTCRGVELFNTKFSTVTLSNSYNDLLKNLVTQGNIPFTHVFSPDLFGSFKPNPKVYLGAAEKMGVKPEECALVAAHLGDLKGAKACGFYAIYVERPLEEKALELRSEGIPDMHIAPDENGFVTLAERLGINAGQKE